MKINKRPLVLMLLALATSASNHAMDLSENPVNSQTKQGDEDKKQDIVSNLKKEFGLITEESELSRLRDAFDLENIEIAEHPEISELKNVESAPGFLGGSTPSHQNELARNQNPANNMPNGLIQIDTTRETGEAPVQTEPQIIELHQAPVNPQPLNQEDVDAQAKKIINDLSTAQDKRAFVYRFDYDSAFQDAWTKINTLFSKKNLTSNSNNFKPDQDSVDTLFKLMVLNHTNASSLNFLCSALKIFFSKDCAVRESDTLTNSLIKYFWNCDLGYLGPNPAVTALRTIFLNTDRKPTFEQESLLLSNPNVYSFSDDYGQTIGNTGIFGQTREGRLVIQDIIRHFNDSKSLEKIPLDLYLPLVCSELGLPVSTNTCSRLFDTFTKKVGFPTEDCLMLNRLAKVVFEKNKPELIEIKKYKHMYIDNLLKCAPFWSEKDQYNTHKVPPKRLRYLAKDPFKIRFPVIGGACSAMGLVEGYLGVPPLDDGVRFVLKALMPLIDRLEIEENRRLEEERNIQKDRIEREKNIYDLEKDLEKAKIYFKPKKAQILEDIINKKIEEDIENIKVYVASKVIKKTSEKLGRMEQYRALDKKWTERAIRNSDKIFADSRKKIADSEKQIADSKNQLVLFKKPLKEGYEKLDNIDNDLIDIENEIDAQKEYYRMNYPESEVFEEPVVQTVVQNEDKIIQLDLSNMKKTRALSDLAPNIESD